MQCEMVWHIESGSFIVLAGYGTSDVYTIIPQDQNPRPLDDVWMLYKGPINGESLCGPTSFGACVQALYDRLAPQAVDSRKVARVVVTPPEAVGRPTQVEVTLEPNVQRVDFTAEVGSGVTITQTDLPDGTTGDIPGIPRSTVTRLAPFPYFEQLPPEDDAQ